MMIRLLLASATLAAAVLTASPAAAAQALVPMERQGGLDSIRIAPPEAARKKAPAMERLGIDKESASESVVISRKDPLVMLSEPRAGVVTRSFQAVSGSIGNDISKAFIRINDDTSVVPVVDGRFSAACALRPGLNTITVLAWDLEGNLGRNSLKVFLRPDTRGPKISVTEPADGSRLDITRNRVAVVRARVSDPSVREGVLVLNNVPRKVSIEGGVLSQELVLMPGTNEIFVEVEDGQGRTGTSMPVRVYTFDAMPKDLVAALTWDTDSSDLDLHVWDSFGHHTFSDARDPYQCDAAIPKGSLDMDRRGGYGPEVFSLESAEPEVYSFYAKYNTGIKADRGTNAYLRLLLYGDEPARRITRLFGPYRLDEQRPSWEAAIVKMPEGVFFQEKDADLKKTLGMDAKAVRRLALIIDEENTAFGLLAISAMGQIKSEEAVGPLLEALASGQAEFRRAAAGALWNIRSVESVEGLMAALSDDDPDVRRAAAGALGNIGDPRAVYPLTSLLAEEGDVLVRVEAIRALGGVRDPRALDTLFSQAKDPEPMVRVEAMRALGGIGGAGAEAALTMALKDAFRGVRETAAMALGRLGAESAVRELMDLLYFDEDDGVRVQAAVALGRIGLEDSVAELERAADRDSSQSVRFCARKALDAMAPPPAAEAAPAPQYEPAPMDEDLVIY